MKVVSNTNEENSTANSGDWTEIHLVFETYDKMFLKFQTSDIYGH